MVTVLRDGVLRENEAKSRKQSVLRDLAWRQKYLGKDEYMMEINGKQLKFRQRVQSELQGLGTGGTVWPAAHVLAKYMEAYYSKDMKNLRVLDLGAGTGVAGIAAMALNAKEVFLSDIPDILFLAQINIEINTEVLFPPSRQNIDLPIKTLSFDWEAEKDNYFSLTTKNHYDLILVSECVLPQLYPLEPLSEVLASLLKNKDNKALIAYEHRPYPYFDPITKFSELLKERGLSISRVSQTDLDPLYQADDIFLFWVSSIPFPTDATTNKLLCHSWGEQESMNKAHFSLNAQSFHLYLDQKNEQIGGALWPSALVAARYLLAIDALHNHIPMKVLELGAGTGLVSTVLAMRNHTIISTDLPGSTAISLLKKNLSNFLNVTILPYAWGQQDALLDSNSFDLIVCSDCLYDSSAVQPLLASLYQLLTDENTCPVLLLFNEQRTALDTFLSAFRASASFSHLQVDNMHLPSAFAFIDCLPPHRQPPPIASFLIRRTVNLYPQSQPHQGHQASEATTTSASVFLRHLDPLLSSASS